MRSTPVHARIGAGRGANRGVSGVAVAEEPSEDKVRAELDACLARRTGKGSGRTAADFGLTRLHLLDASITRYIEQRTEVTRHEPGAVDLADRPVYDVLRDHELGPEEKPLDKPLELVRRGTVHIRPCGCGNGRQQCPDCKGMTYRTCEPAQPCPVCEGVSPCSQYLKHGGLPGTPPRPPKARKAARPEERVTCAACHTPTAPAQGAGAGEGQVREVPGTGTHPVRALQGHRHRHMRDVPGPRADDVLDGRANRLGAADRGGDPPRPVAPARGERPGSGDWRTDRLGAGDPLPRTSPTTTARSSPRICGS